MKLAEFILRNIEEILEEWEAFARTLPAAKHMDTKDLRDHAAKMLKVIAQDLRQHQSAEEQVEKSKGNAPEPVGAADTAATRHGSDRYQSGFDLNALVSEYRALRATVPRLWTPAVSSGDREPQLSRFNEAIDQALNESVFRYTEEISRSRELFLGILGHDLRTPLGVTLNSAQYLLQSDGLSAQHLKSAAAIHRSATRIQMLTDDLLDLTRTQLGGGLPVELQPMDLAHTCVQVTEEAKALHPGRSITLTLTGNLKGSWDEGRLYQLLSNLMENAIRHGTSTTLVTLAATGAPESVQIAVHNDGRPIPTAEMQRIFEPMQRGEASHQTTSEGLGLGLFIARAIVDAHHGAIRVESSSAAGTTFTVDLPRREPPNGEPPAQAGSH